MTQAQASEDVIVTLQAQISRLTGRVPVSRNVEYLQRRLADLRKKEADGEPTAAPSSAPAVPTSVSMTVAARDALGRMADAQRIDRSSLVRAALSEYAQRHGMPDECQHFE